MKIAQIWDISKKPLIFWKLLLCFIFIGINFDYYIVKTNFNLFFFWLLFCFRIQSYYFKDLYFFLKLNSILLMWIKLDPFLYTFTLLYIHYIYYICITYTYIYTYTITCTKMNLRIVMYTHLNIGRSISMLIFSFSIWE